MIYVRTKTSGTKISQLKTALFITNYELNSLSRYLVPGDYYSLRDNENTDDERKSCLEFSSSTDV